MALVLSELRQELVELCQKKVRNTLGLSREIVQFSNTPPKSHAYFRHNALKYLQMLEICSPAPMAKKEVDLVQLIGLSIKDKFIDWAWKTTGKLDNSIFLKFHMKFEKVCAELLQQMELDFMRLKVGSTPQTFTLPHYSRTVVHLGLKFPFNVNNKKLSDYPALEAGFYQVCQKIHQDPLTILRIFKPEENDCDLVVLWILLMEAKLPKKYNTTRHVTYN
jgi:hypothetical protein